ncbi:MAG: 50S ribosomal protein L5 [Calditrichaeota bacterium]|jgi:large subunit ribosomal protein L5|nr:50S ribosomal protein L5 [Calditrichota bacterium]MBT7787346.1 50S ribosomal protein L5 [Calditrichota bacterium]
MADKNKKDAQGAKNAKGAKGAKGSKKSGASKGKGKGKVAKSIPLPADYQPRLKKMYTERVSGELEKQFEYKNKMLIPSLQKIVLNVGDGTLHSDSKLAESILQEMTTVSGQKPVLTRARLSISNFKLRQGMVVGCRVTLRSRIMYEFLDRLISIIIPRIRDFRGLSDKSFDGRGNYSFGVKEQIIFPEIDYDKVVKIHGMDITICTSASTDEEALALLSGFGFPFRRRADEIEAA